MELGGQVGQQDKRQQRERRRCKRRSAAGTAPTTSGVIGEAGQGFGTTRAVSGYRRARQFDAEALLLSPYSPNPVGGEVNSKSSTLSRLPPASMTTKKQYTLPSDSPPPGASAYEFSAPPPPTQGHHLLPVYEQISDTGPKKYSTTDTATAVSAVVDGEDVVGDVAADSRDLRDTDPHVVTQQIVLKQRSPSKNAYLSQSSDRRAKHPGENFAGESFPVAVAALAGDGVCGGGEQMADCTSMREEGARRGAPMGFVPEVVSDRVSTRRTDSESDDVADSAIDKIAGRVIGRAASYVIPQDPLETYPDTTMSPSGERKRLDNSAGGNRARPRARPSRSGRMASHRLTISPAASSDDGGRSPSPSSSASMSPSHSPA